MHEWCEYIFSFRLVVAIKQARRDKILNKTRELERERRVEILARTIRYLMEQGPACTYPRQNDRRGEEVR
jgi:hypothetical protein